MLALTPTMLGFKKKTTSMHSLAMIILEGQELVHAYDGYEDGDDVPLLVDQQMLLDWGAKMHPVPNYIANVVLVSAPPVPAVPLHPKFSR
jgi:hypothetical protein